MGLCAFWEVCLVTQHARYGVKTNVKLRPSSNKQLVAYVNVEKKNVFTAHVILFRRDLARI